MKLPKFHLRDLFWLVLVVAILASVIFVGRRILWTEYVDADYGHTIVSGNDDGFHHLSTGLRYQPVAAIYLRDPTGQVHELRALEERMMQSWPPPSGPYVYGGRLADGSESKDYMVAFGMVRFSATKVVHASIGSSDWEIGPSREGKFVKLPMTKDEMEQIFGRNYEMVYDMRKLFWDGRP